MLRSTVCTKKPWSKRIQSLDVTRMVCNICLSDDCGDRYDSSRSFGIWLVRHFERSAIVPCNVRLEFNRITDATLAFEAKKGEIFIASLRKAHTMTRICGSGWESFMEQKSLSEGSLARFDMKENIFKERWKEFLFEKDLSFDDGVLIRHIAFEEFK